MAQVVTREVVIDVPVERFYDVITDYERYPQFVPQVRKTRISATEGSHRDVEYELDLGIKKIRYTLRHVEERPRKVSWSLLTSDLMKVSNGSWELSDEGGKTRARYSVEIQISKPPFVPQSIVDRIADELTRVSLPKTLDAFKARAEGK